MSCATRCAVVQFNKSMLSAHAHWYAFFHRLEISCNFNFLVSLLPKIDQLTSKITMPLVTKNDPSVADIDKSVRNKFKWQWLQEKVDYSFKTGKLAGVTQHIIVGKVLAKSTKPGYAWCNVCEDEINYGSSGKRALKIHLQQAKHITKYQLRVENQKIVSSKEPGVPLITTSRAENQVVSISDVVAQNQVNYTLLFTFFFYFFVIILQSKIISDLKILFYI